MTVLELGSGPGFLAACLLETLPACRLTLLDFSAPMHDLARATLGRRAADVRFVERSFKEPNWSQGLGYFDAVVTNQAVHELRHKRYASQLHAEVKEILKPDGTYLVSDHFFGKGGLTNDQLYLTVSEQRDALLNAGFSEVRKVAAAGTLVMHRATGMRRRVVRAYCPKTGSNVDVEFPGVSGPVVRRGLLRLDPARAGRRDHALAGRESRVAGAAPRATAAPQ